jgi:hypothetical protein
MATEVQIYKDGTIVSADIADDSLTSNKLVPTSNGRGTRTITENPPQSTDGVDGDVWYVIDALSQGGNAISVTNGVYTVGDQIIYGTKTFTSTISGNAATASNLAGTPNINVGLITMDNNPFIRMKPNITQNYTVNTTYNEMSIGPITINNGVTVTVNSGATWTVV